MIITAEQLAEVCKHCQEHRRCHNVILDQKVCQRCWLRFRRATKPCPGCDQPRVLAFYDAQRRPACARCTGHDPVYACIDCGREDSPFGTRCAPCELLRRLTRLLDDGTGKVNPQLQPVFNALLAAPRPQSVHYWLTRRSSRPDILTSMARGDLSISHAAFDQIPIDRAVTYVRDLLAGTGVIDPYSAGLEAVPAWLAKLRAELPDEHGDLIERFARWGLFRKLRRQPDPHTIARPRVDHARSKVLAAIRFLRWLDEQQLTLADTGQADLDTYLATYPSRRSTLTAFVDWTASTGAVGGLTIPRPERALPEVVLSDQQRWRHVEQLLHDDTIRLHIRVAGLLTLLFAQPLTRVLQMRTGQIHPGPPVTITFDTDQVELPDVINDLVLRQHERATGTPANDLENWLFPGRQHGRRVTRENVRHGLVARGIHPGDARKAAMLQLAAEMPSPVLADLLGVAPVTATRWAALAARDWSQYAAMRRAAPT